MMLERSRVTVVAEILFSRRLSSEEQEERIHCRCSRAFVQDRALYRSDNRLLPFDPADTRVQEADDEEEEEEEEKEEVLDEEAQLMASMGLPVTFLCSSDRRRAGRRSNRKPAPYQAESAEEEEDDVQVDHTDGVKEACDPPEEATGGTDAAGWETYWAQQGQALLWSSWLEKHPETDPGSVTALWDDPDTNAVWDKHAAETYYSYWEQYSYWSAQGWTTGGEEAAAAAAGGGVGGDKEAHPEDQRDGQPGAESQQRDQEGGGDLNDLLGQKCTLEAGGRCVSDSEAGRQRVGVAEPSDGGGDGKRPAASSPQNNAEHTGLIPGLGGPSVRSLHVLPVSAWVPSGFSRFLPQSKDCSG